jgi:hypothetical protein
MPYWDWALPQDKGSVFPQLALEEDSLPGDLREKAELKYNPLHRYVFPEKKNLSEEEERAWERITYVRTSLCALPSSPIVCYELFFCLTLAKRERGMQKSGMLMRRF